MIMSNHEVIELLDDYSPMKPINRGQRNETVIEILSDDELDHDVFVDALNEDQYVDAELEEILGSKGVSSDKANSTKVSSVKKGPVPESRKLFISSSPIAKSIENDSIVDSTFSFSKTHAPEVKMASTSILDIDHWISDSDSDNDSSKPTKAVRSSTMPVTANTGFQKVNVVVDDILDTLSPISSSQPIPSSASKRPKVNMETPQRIVSATSKFSIIPSPLPPIPRVSKPKNQVTVPPTQSSQQFEFIIENQSQLQPKPKAKPRAKPKQTEEKQQLNKANRVTRSKEELLTEMTLVLSSTIIPKFKLEILTSTLYPSKYETSFEDLPVVYWKRRVKATYDKENDIFRPCEEKDIVEKNIVLYYSAEEFFRKVQENTLKHVINQAKVFYNSLLPVHEDCVITILIEGLELFINKIKNKEQKEYKESVIQRMNPDDIPRSQPKKRKADAMDDITMSSKSVEFILQKAQVELKIVTFPVRNASEGIMWLQSFTYTIAQALYDKFERNSSLANLPTIKSGKDTKSTFMQSIQQFKFMTESKTERLFMFFPSLKAIHDRFVSNGSIGKDSTGRNIIPPSTDVAMKNFFMAKDPNTAINESI
ncbi:hypothetical protein DFJ63DRAFT_237989 [Scheffersomyces coipomensis]|uniref:uncharacterized protein n=1 Tax=Scheffersomyces coipomensis TaxID=1788519 RepID=UPI00315D6205